MSAAERDGAPVLTWTQGAGELAGLWERVGELGWLPDSSRIVVQVGQRSRSSVLLETARSLVQFIQGRQPRARVEILDPDGSEVDWSGLPVRRIGDGAAIGVVGIVAPELDIPRLWFETYTLITVVSPVPCRRGGLAGVLDAQAGPLRRLGNQAETATLAYEAHRLAPSDFAVACGAVTGPDGGSSRWWVVGPSDVAVERAVAAAAGVPDQQLPVIRALARHERLPAHQCFGDPLPPLGECVATGWLVQAYEACGRLRGAACVLVRDATVIWRNLGKIPGFVRRRLASRPRGNA